VENFPDSEVAHLTPSEQPKKNLPDLIQVKILAQTHQVIKAPWGDCKAQNDKVLSQNNNKR